MINAFITSIKMLLSFDFFVYALVAGIALAIVFTLFGTFVVMRKEANIAHAISHFALLGVSVALLMNRTVYPSMVMGALLGSVLISVLKKTNWFSHDSINEILAQGGLVASIIVLSFVLGYKANIMDYLFGDILTITFNDVVSTLILCLIVVILFMRYHSVMFQVSFHRELAMSKGHKVALINGIYMFLLSLAIATSIKIIGVLLVTAFLIIPVNISKLIAHNYRQNIYISFGIAVFSVIIGLFSSYFFDIASGAMIIGILILILFGLSLGKSVYQKIR